MATRWFSCTRSRAARGQHHVELVFPGGHVELLDRPTLAAAVMARHPRFCVARPDVFREPAGAVAAPDAVLQLGHKYYVVPSSTVRRLLQLKCSSSSLSASTSPRAEGEGRSPGTRGRAGGGGDGIVTLRTHLAREKAEDRVGGSRRWFFRCLVGGEAKARGPPCRRERVSVDYMGKIETVSWELDVKETEDGGKAPNGGSPGRRRRRVASPGNSTSYSWQPSLHSITEE